MPNLNLWYITICITQNNYKVLRVVELEFKFSISLV